MSVSFVHTFLLIGIFPPEPNSPHKDTTKKSIIETCFGPGVEERTLLVLVLVGVGSFSVYGDHSNERCFE